MKKRICLASLLNYLVRKGAGACGAGWLLRDRLGALAMQGEAFAAIAREGKRTFQAVGLPRSGTTLLAARLDDHPAIGCLIEPFYGWMRHGYIDLPPWAREALGGRAYWTRPPAALFGALCRRAGRSRVGYKEVYQDDSHHFFSSASFLEENFRAGRLDDTLAIVRHPLDIWYSTIRRPSNRDRSPGEGFTRLWNRFALWVCGENVPHVRYEDLATRPAACLQEACESLALPFDEAMLRASGTKPGTGDATAQAGAEVFASSVGGGGRRLPAETRAFILDECGAMMERLGYDG